MKYRSLRQEVPRTVYFAAFQADQAAGTFVVRAAAPPAAMRGSLQGAVDRVDRRSFYNLSAERAVGDFDQPFNNTTSVLWELPFGKGRRHMSSMHPVAEAILGGWQTSIINSLWSGQPVNLAYNPAAAFQVSLTIPDWRGGISYRPNVTGDIMVPKGQRNQDNWLDPPKVVAPTDVRQPFGNAGRNIGCRPDLAQMDFGPTSATRGLTAQWRASDRSARRRSRLDRFSSHRDWRFSPWQKPLPDGRSVTD